MICSLYFHLTLHVDIDLKVFVPRTRLEVRKWFFSSKVVSQWNNLSPDTVSSSSLEQFKISLTADLGEKLFEIPLITNLFYTFICFYNWLFKFM